MEVQWFPGHMAKTRKMMEEQIQLVDVVVEVVDARIPAGSKNPYLDELWKRRPRIIAMNKADLADPARTARWKSWYEAQGYGTVLLDSLHGKGVSEIQPLAQKLCRDKLEKEKERGRQGRALRLMITGIPNVGKSTLINRIAGRSEAAKTGNRPGVTRAKQWIRLRGNMELLDTPGILWPKFDDERVGILLACTGAIKDDILDVETLGCKLMELLSVQAPQTIVDRYSVSIPEEECDFLGYELLQQAGKRRGFLLRGGEIDTERMARILLDEFRGGVLGRITLEMPAAAEQGADA